MFVRELRESLSSIHGLGPKAQALLAQLGLRYISDLLLLRPRDYEDKRQVQNLADYAAHAKLFSRVRVTGHEWFGYGRMKTLKVLVEDGSARASLVCFNRPFLENQLRLGQEYYVYAAFQYRYGELQASAFEFDPADDPKRQGGLIPVYPLTAGLSQAAMRKFVTQALKASLDKIEEELPEGLRERRGLLGSRGALRAMHAPTTVEEPELARRSLAYAELFFLELMIGRRSQQRKATESSRERPVSERLGLKNRLLERLPFKLTADQLSALAEIEADMDGPRPMARLLQGDVGSGKTLVAFFACLKAIERGGQAALMAPTELLARQHAETAARLLEPLGLRLAFLSGNVNHGGRKALLANLALGQIDMVIGTHALFSADVVFRRLDLAVIDEQQRFGVMQRLAFSRKAREPDLLMMSATPIPRSLALTAFGDLELSAIRQLPAGRLGIKTHLAVRGREAKVYDFVRGELERGHQAYFVYPLIGESEALDLKDAEGMARELAENIFPDYPCALIHSRLDEAEKLRIMGDFKEGRVRVLAATSVVEVGVDVPQATCMVVEHAERFGLAALHQLRGRVGRGPLQSYAFFVYAKDLGEEARQRLKILMETNDGFRIAEEDLRMRGPGQIAGTAQSGELRFYFADLGRDAQLLEEARADAFAILAADPSLASAGLACINQVLSRAPPFSEASAARG